MFQKGQRVCLNDKGRRYYSQDFGGNTPPDKRINLVGRVTYSNAHITYVQPEGGGYTETVYTNCLEEAATEDEVAQAIESIANTPRRGK